MQLLLLIPWLSLILDTQSLRDLFFWSCKCNVRNEKTHPRGKKIVIYGIGTDIVSIKRVQEILKKNRDGFINRVLTEHERALFANKADSAAFCAKRFAAK